MREITRALDSDPLLPIAEVKVALDTEEVSSITAESVA
jgi:hypothetical protein